MLFFQACSSFLYYPKTEIIYPPEQFGIRYENIKFQAHDGANLHAWFFPSEVKPTLGTVVQFHGNAENISSHYLSVVWLIQHGYQVFSFDYRCYGQSSCPEGRPNTERTHYDALAALTKAHQLHRESGASKWILYGQSLGGTIALRAIPDWVAEHPEAAPHLVIADSTFSSYKELYRQKLASTWLTWLFQPLAYVVISNEYAPRRYLSQFTWPLLVIHDKKDPVVDYKNGKTIYDESASRSKELWDFESYRGHVSYFNLNKDKNRKRLLDYLKSL